MTDQEFALAYLQAVEKKHKDYFDTARLCIMNCVAIRGTKLVSVHIINKDLPLEIQQDVESMFWVS
jgi:hypothetical protein